MQNSAPRFSPHRRAPRQVALAMAVAVASVVMGRADAQVLVTDVPAETAASTTATESSAMHLFQTGEQYAKEVEQAATLASQLQQMISSINTVISNPIGSLIPSTTTMKPLDPATVQSLIEAKCNPSGGTGNIVTAALGTAVQALNLNSSIAQQQQTNCGNIITTQADQYNATATLYQQMPQLHGSMSAVTNLMSQMSNFGDSSKATSQSTTLSTEQQQQILEWTARVKMDQGIIDALNQQQSVLATALFNSRPSLVGDIVQAGALKTAFSQ